MLDFRLLYEIDIMKYLIMVSVFYGIIRLTKYLLMRK